MTAGGGPAGAVGRWRARYRTNRLVARFCGRRGPAAWWWAVWRATFPVVRSW